MQNNNFLTKSRWLVTIILLLFLGISNAWGAINNGDLFEQVSSIAANDEIIFVKQSEDGACGAVNTVGRNRKRETIETNSHQYIYLSTDNVVVFVVKTATIDNKTKYGFHDGTGYLESKSNSQNYLGMSTTAASTAPSGTEAWTLGTVSSNVFPLTNHTNTSYYLAFNTSSALFAQYKSSQSKPYIYKKVCSAPTALTGENITTNSVDLTITDGANTSDYEIYHSTSSTAPDVNTTATKTTTSTSYTLSGLNANTTYYVWVRSKCSASRKTGWVALTGNSFKTQSAACTATPSVGAASLNGSFTCSTHFMLIYSHYVKDHLPLLRHRTLGCDQTP